MHSFTVDDLTLLLFTGCEIKTLSFEPLHEKRQIKDIEVKGHEDSPTDTLFVMFDYFTSQSYNPKKCWEPFSAMDANPVHTSITMLQHWINATGKFRINSYILYLLSYLFVVMTIPIFLGVVVGQEVSVWLLSIVLPWIIAGLILLWQRFCYTFEIGRYDFIKHLMALLEKIGHSQRSE